jgi:HAD superfamily hydrolase (TIGR01509 family)
MISTLIFDLSEVLIAGLVGIEQPLSSRLCIPIDGILPAFRGDSFQELCRGKLSENDFLGNIVRTQQWNITLEELKRIIRDNFHNQVPGMLDIVQHLSTEHELVLLSDHGAEWISYIKTIHPFLTIFKAQFFSFELGRTKLERSVFETVLESIGRSPQQCLFIDDNPANLAVAMSIGIRGICFTTANALAQQLKGIGI